MKKETETPFSANLYESPEIAVSTIRTQAALLTSTGIESLEPDHTNDFGSIFGF